MRVYFVQLVCVLDVLDNLQVLVVDVRHLRIFVGLGVGFLLVLVVLLDEILDRFNHGCLDLYKLVAALEDAVLLGSALDVAVQEQD